MQDLLERSSAWLDDQREKFMSRTVLYQHGNDTIEVTATIGQTVFNVDDGQGAAIRVESRDYLIRAANLDFGSGPTEPKCGDRIHETHRGVTYLYEVMAPGDSGGGGGGGGGGESHWRWSDPYRQTLRIHTKQVDQESNP